MLKTSQIKQKITEYSLKAKNIFLEFFVPDESNEFQPNALRSDSLFWYAAGLLIIKIALISLVIILPATNFFSSIAVDRLTTLINKERQNRNLPTLTLNNSLNSVADLKVNDMLTQNYFEHTSPSGITPWHWFKKIGYNFAYAGENLAMGFTETDTVFQAWMDSPAHRDNILNPNFKEMGLSVKSGPVQNRANTLAVLVFGRQFEQPIKTQTAQVPTKTATPAPTPKNTATSSVLPKTTPLPTTALQITLSPAPITLAEQIKLESSLNAQQPPQNNVIAQSAPTHNIGYVPKVLGAFTSKSDEIFKSLYLYFTLFMAIALAVNIFIKIKIQHWTTIAATTMIILLSAVLIFI